MRLKSSRTAAHAILQERTQKLREVSSVAEVTELDVAQRGGPCDALPSP